MKLPIGFVEEIGSGLSYLACHAGSLAGAVLGVAMLRASIRPIVVLKGEKLLAEKNIGLQNLLEMIWIIEIRPAMDPTRQSRY